MFLARTLTKGTAQNASKHAILSEKFYFGERGIERGIAPPTFLLR